MFIRDQNYTGEYSGIIWWPETQFSSEIRITLGNIVVSHGHLLHNVHQRSELHWGIYSGITWSPVTQCSSEVRITLGNIQWYHMVT